MGLLTLSRPSTTTGAAVRIESNVTRLPMMRLMYPVASMLRAVDENELVYATQETYADGGIGVGERRYQVLFIPRDDHMAAFWTDLGPKSDFVMHVEDCSYPAPPYLQPVLLCHTVAECRWMADESRQDDYAAKLLHESINTSDLFARYEQLIQEDIQRVKNASVFGPGGFTQRNEYSHLAAAEEARRQSERQNPNG